VSGNSFENNVFINCPFDEDYLPLLRPIIFTVVALGFNPKIALERADSGEIRIVKIVELIKDSKYSIHDLSRMKSDSPDEIFRMNMPFELGVDFGIRIISTNHLNDKRYLIIETEKYRYQKALSDLAAVDIKFHKNDPTQIVKIVRHWFVSEAGLKKIKSPKFIWYDFNDFMSDFYDERKKEGFSDEDLNIMPIPEFVDHINNWCNEHF